MTTSEIGCTREGCTQTFKVGGEDSARCPSCGREHTAPWPHQEDATDDPEPQPEPTAELEAPAGATVRITIEVTPSTEAGR